MDKHQHINASMRECIKNCQECHAVCLETIHHCLHMGGDHAEAHHIRLMADCIEICQTSANFMLRGSDLHGQTCHVCAGVCRQCAEDCMRLAKDDEQMKKCAEQCSRCAESCQKMAA